MFGNFIYLYLASHQHQVSTKHDIGLGSSTGGNRGGWWIEGGRGRESIVGYMFKEHVNEQLKKRLRTAELQVQDNKT